MCGRRSRVVWTRTTVYGRSTRAMPGARLVRSRCCQAASWCHRGSRTAGGSGRSTWTGPAPCSPRTAGAATDRKSRRVLFRSAGPIPLLPSSELVSPRLADGRGFWPFDVDRARALLAENGWDVNVSPAVCVRPGTGPGEAGAGIPAGTRLSLSLRYWAGRPALTRLLQQFQADAAKAGIELRLADIVGSILAAEDGPGASTPERPRLWELSCWGGGWVYTYPTDENLFQSGAACNFSNYQDARADELIARTVTADDLGALHEYQEYISEQVPVLFTPTFPRRLFEVASNLRGFTPINPYGLINPENWYYVEETP